MPDVIISEATLRSLIESLKVSAQSLDRAAGKMDRATEAQIRSEERLLNMKKEVERLDYTVLSNHKEFKDFQGDINDRVEENTKKHHFLEGGKGAIMLGLSFVLGLIGLWKGFVK